MKVRKKFYWQGVEMRIVSTEQKYMESSELVRVTKVIAPNGGTLPMQIEQGQTLKVIAANACELLDRIEKSGCNTKHELIRELDYEN